MNKDYCDKHPKRFDDYSPKEFADKFVNTNFFYQEEVLKELVLRYKKEAEGDFNRNSLKDPMSRRIQLASSLEKVSGALEEHVLEPFKGVTNACKRYMKNPFK